MTYPAYEGLQAAPSDHPEVDQTREGLQPVPHHEGEECVSHNNSKVSCDSAGARSPLQGTGPNLCNKAPQYIEGGKTWKEPTICGLRRKTFWRLLLVIIAVVLAAVVGGGVGGVLANKSNSSVIKAQAAGRSDDTSSSTTSSTTSSSKTSTSSSSTSTSPVTTTSYAADAYPTTSLGIDCPTINDTTRVFTNTANTKAYTFNIYCNANFAAGKDLSYSNQTSLLDCMQSCADNLMSGGSCEGVVWDSVMNLAIQDPRRNCFLKTTQGAITWTGLSNNSASALLQT